MSTATRPGDSLLVMSKLMRILAVAVLALLGAAVPSGAATASGDPAGGHQAVTAIGGVDDFTFDSFDAQYTLGIDDEQRSTLTTVETLVAVFPDFDQNRGVRRYIPSTYDGHQLHNRVVSVTDENGQPRDFDVTYEPDDGSDEFFQVLTIAVPEGQYVQGTQTYVITYEQRDVTAFFENTNDDEFYWDVNGTGWAQPFGEVSATLTFADGLASELVSTDCYYGPNGSNQQCDATVADGTVTASVADLGPYQNLTIVAAFPAHTFVEAPFDMFAIIPPVIFGGLAASLGGALLALIFRFTVLRGAKGTGIVIAQYEPHEAISPLLAANLLDKTKKGMAAAIVDLAVRRKIRIVERPDEGFFASGTTFGVQHIGDDTDVDTDDRRVLDALFATVGLGMLARLLRSGGASAPGIITIGQQMQQEAAAVTQGPTGEVRWLVKKDQILGQQVVSITKAVAAEAKALNLRGNPPILPIAIVTILVIAGFLLLLFGGIGAQSEAGIVIGVFGTIIASWIGVGALIMLGSRRPLTKEGALAKEHLEGLREYIRLAEADRLQMLQSVTGAERTPLDKTATGGPDVIKIYEKLLPYAVLFGLEKEWAGELAKYYDETPPDWYQGSNITAFNVGAFAGAIGSLSTSVSTSYSGSASSSSSGGSGGGGSSGGGGGGGGGGGV